MATPLPLEHASVAFLRCVGEVNDAGRVLGRRAAANALLAEAPDMPLPRTSGSAAAKARLAWIWDLSERRVLEPVDEQCLLAEDFDTRIGGRQPAGQDKQQAGSRPADRDVGLPWPSWAVTPDGARVTSHSPVPDSPGSVA